MSHRKSTVVTVRRKMDGTPTTGSEIPEITVQIRVHWPTYATEPEVLQALADAIAEALTGLMKDMPYGRPNA